ncbi:MBL fold metallo-hydrolase [Thermoactinomyces mirandus]|uniref:MBL fold metallo-hydrolase n=1 Tax=Thermoactinomyces mirandus TaxID=2756294 RepID=A0A7W1XVG2_9BACL|nr:MBL fold metallo-hydrolase [Thermoactinomyces mirandus]MBA4603812.1 MBL fold metallo-hydrolase [Thermoactinomyces mirandus]
MLNFIGCGSAFNTGSGNNAAFIKKDNVLFLIDCGSSIFGRLKNSNIFDRVEYICVILTHTHADHVGSLGDLIAYGYYAMGKTGEPNVYVIAPYDLRIGQLLKLMGVNENTYKLSQFNETTEFHMNHFHIDLEAVPVKHVKQLNCYGYIIYYENKTIYYSGDCYEIPQRILEKLHNGTIDLFYQDTCKADYEGNVHLSLKKLDQLIDRKVRGKVYCMHLDSGFNAVTSFISGT